ncbi:hypothetical protein QJS66_04780 [Kocuria rhizophila]|nr:hypothetical protein QJS66_04780 [Kocuria rhizophila]
MSQAIRSNNPLTSCYAATATSRAGPEPGRGGWTTTWRAAWSSPRPGRGRYGLQLGAPGPGLGRQGCVLEDIWPDPAGGPGGADDASIEQRGDVRPRVAGAVFDGDAGAGRPRYCPRVT